MERHDLQRRPQPAGVPQQASHHLQRARQPLLSGGRPGLFLWVGDVTGETWTPINVAAVHNSLVPAYKRNQGWLYEEGFVNGSAYGLPCSPSTGPAATTSYTSLLAVDGGFGQGNLGEEYILLYDRLANGLQYPPGPYGSKDRTFSLRFKLKSDDHAGIIAPALRPGPAGTVPGGPRKSHCYK